jgi:membrane-associated HD superfamily phosphohydrolase
MNTTLKTGGGLSCSGRVSISCSTLSFYLLVLCWRVLYIWTGTKELKNHGHLYRTFISWMRSVITKNIFPFQSNWVHPLFLELCSCYSIFRFICMFCRSLFLSLFLLAIVLSVLLRLTDSDYPFGIFKPFLSSGYNFIYYQNTILDKDLEWYL